MSVIINNISIGGAFVHCLREPAHDEPLRMVIKATPREELLLVTAEMVWSNLDITNVTSSRIGVRLTKVFADNHKFLSERVSEHLNTVFKKEPSKNWPGTEIAHTVHLQRYFGFPMAVNICIKALLAN